jgi:hypothetical protein
MTYESIVNCQNKTEIFEFPSHVSISEKIIKLLLLVERTSVTSFLRLN